jgi:hypothetical protein
MARDDLVEIGIKGDLSRFTNAAEAKAAEAYATPPVSAGRQVKKLLPAQAQVKRVTTPMIMILKMRFMQFNRAKSWMT